MALENSVMNPFARIDPMLLVRVSVIHFIITLLLSSSMYLDSLLWKNSYSVDTS